MVSSKNVVFYPINAGRVVFERINFDFLQQKFEKGDVIDDFSYSFYIHRQLYKISIGSTADAVFDFPV